MLLSPFSYFCYTVIIVFHFQFYLLLLLFVQINNQVNNRLKVAWRIMKACISHWAETMASASSAQRFLVVLPVACCPQHRSRASHGALRLRTAVRKPFRSHCAIRFQYLRTQISPSPPRNSAADSLTRQQVSLNGSCSSSLTSSANSLSHTVSSTLRAVGWMWSKVN